MIKKLYVAMLCMVISSPVLAEDSVYDFNLTSIDYTEMPLEQYHGKAILLVNTASQCGFTPQYEGLQALWENYRDKGLIVLGVPSNDFGGQEPDSEDDIKEFCTINFDVDLRNISLSLKWEKTTNNSTSRSSTNIVNFIL